MLYFSGRVLGINDSDGIDDLGDMRWELVLCLLAAWCLVCGALIKGIKSSGKVGTLHSEKSTLSIKGH